ncbi:hypothetical protein TNCV_967461 [Trichonephila clavipes]|nr:hypothetical protein TNCV_967441 [Trichonephila clavipes]GFT46829.1 hypothetical protein TNCV_967461 [Trichonephila clavipes]
MFSWKETLKHRVKMICKNALMMITYDHLPRSNERPHHRTPSMFHSKNQTVNIKCFSQCFPDKHTLGGLEYCKGRFIRPDGLFPLQLSLYQSTVGDRLTNIIRSKTMFAIRIVR